MHRTGRYRQLNLIFGIFPFVAAVLISLMREDSPQVLLWLSIVRIGKEQTSACTNRVGSASPGIR